MVGIEQQQAFVKDAVEIAEQSGIEPEVKDILIRLLSSLTRQGIVSALTGTEKAALERVGKKPEEINAHFSPNPPTATLSKDRSSWDSEDFSGQDE